MPALADLPLGAGDLPAVVVDVEVVPSEALASAVLSGGIAPERPGDGDLVITCGLFQVGQGGVAAVDQVLGGQQAAAVQAGVDAGQDLAVVHSGRGGGHVRDHVRAVGSTRLGQMSGEPLPADEVPVAGIAGRRVIWGDDRPGRGRQPGPVFRLGGAPEQVSRNAAVVVLHHDLTQGLDARAGHAVCSVLIEVFQEPDGVVAGGEDPGLGLGGVFAQAGRTAITAPPFLVDQQVRDGAGDFLQRDTDRLGDQLQPGQVADRGQGSSQSRV
ncbi:hypothetical protein [Streptomyces viridosporus]|uniref:hypothetical protein n=1 Tax=Streptomyces viridosporus TaxID=67581 RepID=UPI0036F80B0A